jgi:predicted component of type VI protein secretion system
LFLGRSTQCDITVNDPTVSRRHCEIAAVNGAIELHDLGSSNLTLVNGQPVKSARLHLGDRLTIGTAHFLVEEDPDREEVAPVPASARRSLAVERNMYMDESRLPELIESGGKGVEALSRLFRFSRVLSQTQSIQELAMIVHANLVESFQPQSCWLARYVEERSSLTFFDESGVVVDAPEDAPRKIIEAAFFRRSGLLWPRMKEGVVEAQIAAPLVVPDKRVGIIVMQSRPDQLFDLQDLEYVAALAHTAAPFVQSTLQAEQTQLSLTKLRRQWGL